jgi:hypothetical protein
LPFERIYRKSFVISHTKNVKIDAKTATCVSRLSRSDRHGCEKKESLVNLE